MISLSPDEDQPSASPFPRARVNRAASGSEGFADVAPLTVLLVEDNQTDIFVIKEVIAASALNFDLRIARNGHDALLYLQGLAGGEKPSCPALVLLDLNVPMVDGVEILRQLRSASGCERTPVIVVTSSTAEEDRAAVERLGAEGYFQKPKDLAAYMELAQLIKQILASSQKRHES